MKVSGYMYIIYGRNAEILKDVTPTEKNKGNQSCLMVFIPCGIGLKQNRQK